MIANYTGTCRDVIVLRHQVEVLIRVLTAFPAPVGGHVGCGEGELGLGSRELEMEIEIEVGLMVDDE